MITEMLERSYLGYASSHQLIKAFVVFLLFTTYILSYSSSIVHAQTPISGVVYKVSGNQTCTSSSPTEGVEGVTLDIYDADTNVLLSSELSSTDGSYSANIAATNVKISPSLPTNAFNNGISTFDAVITRQHILGQRNLDCPFQRIAADVNNDGSIGFGDTTLIAQLVLGTIPSFPDVPSWRFVAKNYTRTDSYNRDIRFPLDFWNPAIADESGNEYPFKATYDYDGANSYDYNSSAEIWMDVLHVYPVDLVCDAPSWDFYAIKSGDVSQSVMLSSFTGNIENQRQENIYSVKPTASKTLKNNALYEIEITATSLYPIVAFQLGVKHEENIAVQSIIPNSALNDYAFENHFLQSDNSESSMNRQIKTLWIEPNLQATSIEEELVLFSLIVQMDSEINLVNEMLIDDELMEIEFISIIDKQAVLVPTELSIKIKEL